MPKGPLEIAHVGILFWIDLGIGEQNRQVTAKIVSQKHLRIRDNVLDVELHDDSDVGLLASCQPGEVWMSTSLSTTIITAL